MSTARRTSSGSERSGFLQPLGNALGDEAADAKQEPGTPAAIARAARWLQGGADIVLAPAQDGGYALIGARRISAEVFSAVEWGSERVLAQTRANLLRARLRLRCLPTVWDVDRPEDLERLGALRLPPAARRGARR